MKRLYEIRITSNNGPEYGPEYNLHWITTSDVVATEHYLKVCELNAEDKVTLYSQVSDCSLIQTLQLI